MVFTVFAILSLIANAVLTGVFGLEFLNGALGVVLMLLFFDVAALSWYCARQSTNLSGDQRAAAKIMSIATIVGSTLVSVVQVLDMASAIEAGGWGHTFAVYLVTAFAALNFIALFFYQYTSVAERAVDMAEELTAQTNDKVAEMTREAHSKAMNRAQRVLMGKTDIIGDRIAHDVERDFLRAMGSLDLLGEAPVAPTSTPPTNYSPPSNQGAVAGAVTEVATPTPSATSSPVYNASELPEVVDATCACGIPIGEAEGECTADVCMIDTNRENLTPAALTNYANDYLAEHGNLTGFREWFWVNIPVGPSSTMTAEQIDECIDEMTANAEKPLDLNLGK